ncbi:MAG: gliding motility-associated C-terminal domain-containing protein [Elusimicrobiota bacterium]|nr:MAG: gliding motility-associated C-terminal domain-containing protein [Elusimicrobiota bacterium]
MDRPLTLGPTYFYKISARDLGLTEGPFSATVGALPFTIAPMEPLGVRIAATPADVTLSWSTTTRYGDGNLFLSTAAPLADELLGYSVWRSSDACAPTFVNVSSLPITQTSTVSLTGGLNWFYRVHSYNSIGLSTNAVTLSTLGERSYFLDDCVSRVVFDAASAEMLNAGSNSAGGDIRIDRRRVTEDVGENVFQSVKFTPMLNGVTPLTNYPMPKPVRVVLAFQTAGGQPVATQQTAPGVTVKNLGMFWFNGQEFKKMYGTVDPVAQTVTVESPNLGTYQIRALARADGTVFDVSNISGRALTPNGDGLNDSIIFTYDPGPRNETATGRIYDVLGSHVADMVPGRVPNTLTWDGRSNGRVVGGGAYVYRIQGGGKSYTGTVVVAR